MEQKIVVVERIVVDLISLLALMVGKVMAGLLQLHGHALIISMIVVLQRNVHQEEHLMDKPFISLDQLALRVVSFLIVTETAEQTIAIIMHHRIQLITALLL